MYVGFLSMLSDADLIYTKIKEKICTLEILCFDQCNGMLLFSQMMRKNEPQRATAIDDNEADGNLYKLFGKISTGQYTRSIQPIFTACMPLTVFNYIYNHSYNKSFASLNTRLSFFLHIEENCEIGTGQPATPISNVIHGDLIFSIT